MIDLRNLIGVYFLLTQHLAASAGFENIVQFLIQEGADVNVTGKVLLYSLSIHIPLHSLI